MDPLEIAAHLLPGIRPDRARLITTGESHDVVLLPGVAAVRITKRPDAAEALPRRTALLGRLAGLGLPFATPVPLSEVVTVGGDNLRVDARGRYVGVLDWDLAQAFDPAIDVAALVWHGWPTIRAAVDAGTYRRAATWFLVLALTQASSKLLAGEEPDMSRMVVFLERSTTVLAP